jgi:hypothetical protein
VSKDKSSWIVDEQHDFIVHYKIDPGLSINFSENFKIVKTNPWSSSYIVKAQYYNGEYAVTPTPSTVKKPQVATENANFSCFGPDGKTFTTTISACDALSHKWNYSFGYIVDCPIDSKCGGTRKMQQISCNNAGCCQINGIWTITYNKVGCDKTGNTNTTNNNGGTSATNYPQCIVYFAYSKTSLTYYNISPEQCQKWQNDANSTTTQSNLPQPTSVPYQPPTTSPEQTQAIIDQHNSQVETCRSNVTSKYASLIQGCNQYGDSSATAACQNAYGKERQTDYNNCGQTY